TFLPRRLWQDRTERLSTASLQGRSILVVEDDYMIARDVQEELEGAGAAVVGPVPSVSDALHLIESKAIDAAVLDVNLGQERSFPIAEALEARAIPFLFATGYNSADIPDEWQRAVIVMKPLRIEAVEQLLEAGDSR
uniref:response regulator n=1 Tax=uncultured Sphingomonas sp. TaxID=158754 RepID=UPI0025E309C8